MTTGPEAIVCRLGLRRKKDTVYYLHSLAGGTIKPTINFQFPVADDCVHEGYEVIREDLLSREEVVKRSGDVLQRQLVRGDGDKFAELLVTLSGLDAERT